MGSTLGRFQFLKRLTDAGVEYVVIGGVAAILHGSAELMDVDETTCRVLNLDALITAKRAANRPKAITLSTLPDGEPSGSRIVAHMRERGRVRANSAHHWIDPGSRSHQAHR